MGLSRIGLGAVVAGAALLLGGIGPVSDSAEAQTPPPDRSISIMGRSFSARTLKVPQGTKVTWVNNDRVRHEIVSPLVLGQTTPYIGPNLLAAKTGIGACDFTGVACPTFSKTFDTPGTYAFQCSIHRRMAGTIIVTEPERTTVPTPRPVPPTPAPSQGSVARGVSILGRSYSPRVMRIKEGDTVTWVNGSTSPHTSTSISPEGGTSAMTWNESLSARGALQTGEQPDPQTFPRSSAITFNVPGRYQYICLIHPGMAGQIVVDAVNPDA